jgi:hypothetical protein
MERFKDNTPSVMTTAWMTPCDDTFGDDHSVDDRAAKRLHAVSSGTVITRSVSSQLVVSSFEEGHHEVVIATPLR